VFQIDKSYLDAEFMLSREGIYPRQAILIYQKLVLITMFLDSSVIEEDVKIEKIMFVYADWEEAELRVDKESIFQTPWSDFNQMQYSRNQRRQILVAMIVDDF
jgi:hypothetical protein